MFLSLYLLKQNKNKTTKKHNLQKKCQNKMIYPQKVTKFSGIYFMLANLLLGMVLAQEYDC